MQSLFAVAWELIDYRYGTAIGCCLTNKSVWVNDYPGTFALWYISSAVQEHLQVRQTSLCVEHKDNFSEVAAVITNSQTASGSNVSAGTTCR